MESVGNHRQTIGREGEDIACRFLESIGHTILERRHGHTILERNWRSGHLEIDIISHDADGIHFVEVKARKNNIQAPPQENVNIPKQRRTARAAKGFLKTVKGLQYGGHECLFDIAAVTFTGDKAHVEWFPQAFIPIYL